MNVKAKVLYDKKLDQFGHIIKGELYQCSMPYLYNTTVDIEQIKDSLLGEEDIKTLIDNYELIDIVVRPKLSIDEKIAKLKDITSNFLFIEHYTHTGVDMYKIVSEFTHYREMKHVLCPVSEGIEKALDLAIEQISEDKKEFFGE